MTKFIATCSWHTRTHSGQRPTQSTRKYMPGSRGYGLRVRGMVGWWVGWVEYWWQNFM